jgi:hypothetical protein
MIVISVINPNVYISGNSSAYGFVLRDQNVSLFPIFIYERLPSLEHYSVTPRYI